VAKEREELGTKAAIEGIDAAIVGTKAAAGSLARWPSTCVTRLDRAAPRAAQVDPGLLLQSEVRGPFKEGCMLYTIAMILLVMWVLGLITSYTMGGFVHILIVAAVVIVLVRVVQGRRLA
jgi:hypothetical protein